MLTRLTLKDVLSAHERIKPHIRRTPLVKSHTLSRLKNAEVLLKLECWQVTRSFKARGALNRLLQLAPEDRRSGVIAASTGNHAQGVAYAAQLIGSDALIVVPEGTPKSKVEGTRALGGRVREGGADYDESEVLARELARELDRTFIHGFSDPDIVAGQGTVCLEMLLVDPRLDQLIIPVGGGGLISGIALAAKTLDPSVEVIGVQSEASCPMVRSFQAGERTEVTYYPSIADGLYGGIAEETLAMVLRYVDGMVVVTEDDIAGAVRWLVAEERLIVEGSGAVGVAALLSGRLNPEPHSSVGVVISGGNIDYELLQPLLGG